MSSLKGSLCPRIPLQWAWQVISSSQLNSFLYLHVVKVQSKFKLKHSLKPVLEMLCVSVATYDSVFIALTLKILGEDYYAGQVGNSLSYPMSILMFQK